ncbi:MAG: YqgE/AlgH family protein [Rickettsiaceae bacterium]|nr:YqgE/AlgH family protein [Rickettsiaceae bacterium]
MIEGSLAGKLLVANPYCYFNDFFDKSIVYVAIHTNEGAVGLIINKSISTLGIKKLYRISDNSYTEIEKKIFIGGPVEVERSFIMHTPEYSKNLIFSAGEHVSISSSVDVIIDILRGSGPLKSNIILGYTGWGAGQIEHEISENHWLILDSDEDIIFNDHGSSWEHALKKVGIDHSHFTSQMAHT